jgi:hypothetical protein
MGGSSTISTSEPMLGAVRVQQSTYGIAVPVIFGRCRVPLNIGWYGDFRAIAHTSTTEQGGKGGGGVTQQNTTYTYEAAMICFVGEGPLVGPRRVWQGKKQFDSIEQLNLGFMAGAYGQAVWGHLATNHPSEAIGYSGIAYMRSANFSLTRNAEVENHTLEVDGFSQYNGGPDCDPAAVVTQVLTNTSYGARFPAARLAPLTDYSNYCVASGLLISIALTEQRPARDMLGDLLLMTNTGPVWSGGKLKLVPYADQVVTGNGITYTPNVTPLYDLDDDAFVGPDPEDPVKIRRKSPADRYNHVQIEFINSANGYNIETAEAKDQADIERSGLRTMPPIKMHALPNAGAAALVAQTVLQRSLYICNEYEFTLGWDYILLEGMDLVTLTDPRTLMDKVPVRIISIEEDPDGDLSVIAEDFPLGSATAARYPRQASSGYAPNYNAIAGNVNVPVMFEPPSQLGNGLEVWLAVSGKTNYGGCNIWVSYDGETYKKIGWLYGSARQGVLSAPMEAGAAVDTANTLELDLSESGAQLLSGTQDDARNLRTLCYVDGELMAYEVATLTGANMYSLAYLARGGYGTSIRSHAAGSQFARLDQAVFSFPFTLADIGKTIRIKFQAFNTFSVGMQDLPDLEPYSYAIKGSALNSPLPDVTNISSNFVSGITQIYWDVVSDFRSPIDYEVRIGPSWEAGTVVGRTPVAKIPAVGDGQYWIAAHYRSPSGVDAYSAVPKAIVLAGAILTQNVVAAHDEAATGWTGAVFDGASKHGNTVRLMGAGNILASPDVLGEGDVLWLGGVAASGVYEVPISHRINIGRIAPCNVLMSVTGYGQSIYDNLLALPNILGVSDLLGAALGPKVALQSQIRTAGSDGVYGEWQSYVPGIYNAQYFEPRVVMSSFDAQVTAVMSGLNFAVDAPDRVDTGTNLTVPTSGMTVTFASPFNGGHDGDPFPNVNAVVLNARLGDYLVISPATLTEFTVQVMNAGVGVSRDINWTVQGY